MRENQIVTQIDDFVDGQFRRCMGVKESCMVDVFFFTGNEGFDRQQMDINVRAIQGSQLRRKIPYITGLHTGGIDQTGYLHTGFPGQIGDQAGVEHIAPNLVRDIGLHGVHNPGTIFMAHGVYQILVFHQLLAHLLPPGDLPQAASRVFVREFENDRSVRDCGS